VLSKLSKLLTLDYKVHKTKTKLLALPLYKVNFDIRPAYFCEISVLDFRVRKPNGLRKLSEDVGSMDVALKLPLSCTKTYDNGVPNIFESL
jgi:hypothetical protein